MGEYPYTQNLKSKKKHFVFQGTNYNHDLTSFLSHLKEKNVINDISLHFDTNIF